MSFEKTPEEYVRYKHQTRVADRGMRKFRAECSCGTLVSRWRLTYEEAQQNADYHFRNKVKKEVQYRESRRAR